MKALPVMFYRDPADCVDALRRIQSRPVIPREVIVIGPARSAPSGDAELLRRHKRMRIEVLARTAMKVRGGHGE